MKVISKLSYYGLLIIALRAFINMILNSYDTMHVLAKSSINCLARS